MPFASVCDCWLIGVPPSRKKRLARTPTWFSEPKRRPTSSWLPNWVLLIQVVVSLVSGSSAARWAPGGGDDVSAAAPLGGAHGSGYWACQSHKILFTGAVLVGVRAAKPNDGRPMLGFTAFTPTYGSTTG